MRLSTTLGVSLALLLPGAATAQETFQGSITYRVHAEQATAEMTMISKGARTRMNMTIPGMPGGEMYVLMQMDSMIGRAVVPSMGMYMQMDLATMMETAVAMLPVDSLAAAARETRVESLGTSDEIAGIPCRLYRIVSGSEQMESCVATGLGNLGGLQAGGMPGGLNPLAGLLPDMEQFAREFPTGMLPLRMRILRNGSWETVMEALVIDRAVPADALFVLPPGLQRMDPPGH